MTQASTQRATAWLCLAVSVLIALLPAGGVMVCLGQDGHVGFGSPTASAECPCGHGPAAEATRPEANAQRRTDNGRHPPCDDFALDPPEILRDDGIAQRLPEHLVGASDDGDVAADLWAPDADWAGKSSAARRLWASTAAVLPRQQLEHKRVVVLLI